MATSNNSNSMHTLNKEQFNKCISLLALKIPAKQCTLFLTSFKDFVFQRPKMKRIFLIEGDSEHRLLLLSDSVTNIQSLPQDLKDLCEMHNSEIQPYKLNITYDQLGVEEVLRAILPGTITEIPSAFEQAGHMAHMNLREDCLPYKHLIGQVVLDKNPGIKSVVNKIGSIETEFRTFPMELLAGENNYNVLLKESGATFNFNFAEVYWNSRLQMEHSRVINWISGLDVPPSSNSSQNIRATVNANLKTNKQKQKEQSKNNQLQKAQQKERGLDTVESTPSAVTVRKEVVVADMMAGVGPFAVPLSMGNIGDHNITVYANDLNPASYKYLVLNGRTNHCGSRLVPFNMDGRDFILHLLDANIPFHEVIMNLPQNATDFLDVFIGMTTRLGDRYAQSWVASSLPRIHVYAFSTVLEDPVQDIVERSAGVLQCDPKLLNYIRKGDESASGCVVAEEDRAVGHVVRDVSPRKVMVCLSFRLPKEVAFAVPVVSHSGAKKRSAEEAEIDK